MTNNRIANSRLYNQMISGSLHHTPEQVVKKMGAMQAQDYMQAVWAIGLRSPASKLADVERAIAERKIILTWTLRGTLHFVPAEDVKWMLQLSAPRLASQTKRRMVELGLDDQTLESCRKIIVDALKGGKQMDRSVLLQLIEEEGIHTGNQRGYHMLWNCAYQGLICFGPMNGKQQTIVLLEEWVPGCRELSYEGALQELALRYFTARGLATVQDFAWWAGITLTDARRGLESVNNELQSEDINGSEYWMTSHRPAPADEDSGVYLLPGFDEYILGYKDRSAVLEPETAPLIVPGNNGVFLPMIVVGGQVVGTWKRTIKKKGVEIVIHPFGELGNAKEAVFKAAEKYAIFIDLPILNISVYSPLT
ncbi:winged helix DNA-binding domain-containing protein [Paenibacillus odorifer]|uniref:Prevent-host-death protein n=1 Tax=Paenibacillus odorifer TaxID=189426 RepID=A0A1R0XQ67_9BACL|nr:winged helix DNA-binding domain-containing protein [Paenibacillus odorifer]OMD37225.1 prevent-host-death protein [Paenibacillus odorifer]